MEVTLNIGDAHHLLFEALSRTDIVRFAGAGGDFNPLHHDDDFARNAGFPSAFAMGMLTASIAAKLLTQWVPAEEIRHLHVRFKSIVWPGETLKIRAWVSRVSGATASISIQVEASGELKLTGCAELARSGSFSDKHVNDRDQIEDTHWNEGRILTTFAFPVETIKILEFSRALRVHDEDPSLLSGGQLVAPLTFSAASNHYCGNGLEQLASIGLDAKRVVHGEHSWSYYKPIVSGQVLDAQCRLVDLSQIEGRSGRPLRRAISETRYHNSEGDLVLAERRVAIEVAASQ